MKATRLPIRTLSALLGCVALVAFSPASEAAKKKKKCPKMNEQVGCKLKLAGYTGTEKAGGQTYAFVFTIGSSGGHSSLTGAVKASCSGGRPDDPRTSLAAVVQVVKLPKTLTIGKTYTKSKHVDSVGDTGQTKVRFIATETVKVKLISAKKARVTLTIDQSRQTVDPPSDTPPYKCQGTGTETLKRRY